MFLPFHKVAISVITMDMMDIIDPGINTQVNSIVHTFVLRFIYICQMV